MQEFLLILKGDGMNHLSPNELQNIMSEYQNWVQELGDNYIGGQRLTDTGALLTDDKSEVLTDGPFLEAKEIIAGYFLIQAADMAHAVSLAKSSPHLGLYTIEIRAIATPKMS